MKALETDEQIVGQVFGRLTVLRRSHQGPGGHAVWLCQCECGKTLATPLFPLRSGRTQTCGCYGRARLGAFNKTHGKSTTREYAIWNGMKARCLNKKNKCYPRYGGRGVTVCQEWIDSFEAFLAHIGAIPTDGQKYSLDRIKSEKGYEPGNVRWATKEVQANNTRTNRFITAFGRTQTVAQWTRETGICRKAIISRIELLGWTPEKALSQPVGKGRRKADPIKYEPFVWID